MEESKMIHLSLPGVVESEEVTKLKRQLSALTSHLDNAMKEEESLESMHYRTLLQGAIESTKEKLGEV